MFSRVSFLEKKLIKRLLCSECAGRAAPMLRGFERDAFVMHTTQHWTASSILVHVQMSAREPREPTLFFTFRRHYRDLASRVFDVFLFLTSFLTWFGDFEADDVDMEGDGPPDWNAG